jgi:hypothetical protein
MGKGSGSVTTFSGADGFITIDQHAEILDAGSTVSVQLSGGISSRPTSSSSAAIASASISSSAS